MVCSSPLPGKGHSSPPLFDPCLLWSNGRPSQLLLSSCFVYFVVTRGKLSSLSSQSAIFCIRWCQLSSWPKISLSRCKRCVAWAACPTICWLFHEVCVPAFAADTSLAVSKLKLSIQHVPGTCIRPQLWPSSRLVTWRWCSRERLQFRRIIRPWNTCKYNQWIHYTVHLILWYCYFFTPERGAKHCAQCVCLSVSICMSTCMSQRSHVQTSQNFLYMLTVAVAQFSSDSRVILYVCPVLWMISDGGRIP